MDAPAAAPAAEPMWMQAVQQRMDNFVKGFDDFMNWLVFEGIPNAGRALAEKASGAMDSIRNSMSNVAQKAQDFNPFGAKSSPDPSPTIQQAKALETPSPPITPDIAMQAQQAVGQGQKMAFGTVDQSDLGNISPSATPGVGFGGQSYGMGM